MTANKLPSVTEGNTSKEPESAGGARDVEMSLPISPRSRRWGYVFWPKSREAEDKSFFASADFTTIKVPIESARRMRIQWKYCRVFIGTKWSNAIPESHTTFQLTRLRSGTIEVSSR